MERPAAPISIYSPIAWRVILPSHWQRPISFASRPGLGAILNRQSFGREGRKGREKNGRDNAERSLVFTLHRVENLGDIEFRAKLKKTKSVRKVVSGTPCVQRQRGGHITK